MERRYRPWGLIDWVIPRCMQNEWALLGCISTEERSLAAWKRLRAMGRISKSTMIVVRDPPNRFSDETQRRIKRLLSEYDALGGYSEDVYMCDLLCPHSEIASIANRFADSCSGRIIIDVTTFPQRFFFPLLKKIYLNVNVTDIIATYTCPDRYHPGELAEDFNIPQPLPMFGGIDPETPPQVVVVSAGYLVMGLPQQIGLYAPTTRVKLIFPFPPGPPSFQRNLDFVRTLEKNLRHDLIETCPMSAFDSSDAFEHILAFTDNGRIPAAFAPYGPKPISLAMCIFALQSQSAVHYTQPKTYNPDYSTGVSTVNGLPEIYAYCVRLSRNDYYTVPSRL